METTACLLCGATEHTPRLEQQDRLLGLPGRWWLVQCRACGLHYLNPRPTESEMGAYYPPEYDPYMRPPWEEPNPWRRWSGMHGLRKRWGLIEKYKASGQILDVGCATGLFLAAGPAHWARQGVEPGPSAAAFARERLGLTVWEGFLEAVSLPPASFDVITMWDVVEHLHDPRRTLDEVRRLLKPGGIFVFRVPNLDALDARLFGPYWAGLDAPRHTFVPDEASITRLLAATGFRELERCCLSGTYGVLVLSWRFWVNARITTPAARARWQRALDNPATRLALSPLLWATDKLLRKGSLLTVVATPR